jgi:hypothetical protein
MPGGTLWQPVPDAPTPWAPYWLWDGAVVRAGFFAPSHSVVVGQFVVDDTTGAMTPSGVVTPAHAPDQWLVMGSDVGVTPLLVQPIVAPDVPQTAAFVISVAPLKVLYSKETGVTENVLLYVNGQGKSTQPNVADGEGYTISVSVAPGSAVMLKGATSGKSVTVTA